MIWVLRSEIDIICLLLLFGVLYLLRENSDRREERLSFAKVVYATIGVLALDLAWIFFEGRPDALSFFLNYAVNILYVCISGAISFFWLIYTDRIVAYGKRLNRRKIFFQRIPLLLLVGMAVTSPWTHAVFYIDSANVFRDGDWRIVHFIVGYGYLLASIIEILVQSFREKSQERRRELMNVLSFVILPIASLVPSVIWKDIPASWPAGTLALLMVFANMQMYQISTDGLTRLNNRRRFDRYLSELSTDSENKTFLLMMDLNFFKEINDNLGHSTGDKALIVVADILRRACDKERAFAARMGGDEFAVVYTGADFAMAEQLKEKILREMNRVNEQGMEKFKLSISIGIAEFEGSVRNMIALADDRLYEEKRLIHANRR